MAPNIFSRSQLRLARVENDVIGQNEVHRQRSKASDTQSLSSKGAGPSSAASWAEKPPAEPVRSAQKAKFPKWITSSGRAGSSASLQSENASSQSGVDLESKDRLHRRKKSLGLLDALLPGAKPSSHDLNNGTSPSTSSFEVLRVSRGHRTSFSTSRPVPSHEVPAHQPLYQGGVGALPEGGGATARRRTREASSPPVVGMHPSVRSRSSLAALTRRMSGLSAYGQSQPTSPSLEFSPLAYEENLPQGSTSGSFTLRSMRNVRHGSSPALEGLVSSGSYFPAPSSGPEVAPLQADFCTSPILSPEEPLLQHDLGLPGSPNVPSSQSLYKHPTQGGSSMSVAKFRAGRNRSESATLQLDDAILAGASMSGDASRAASPTPGLMLQDGGLRPSERLAALEAEIARGGRATPLLRLYDDAESGRMPRTRENSIGMPLSDPLRLSPNREHGHPERRTMSRTSSGDGQAPAVPVKDHRNSARRSMGSSQLLDRRVATSTSPWQSPRASLQKFTGAWDWPGTPRQVEAPSLAPQVQRSIPFLSSPAFADLEAGKQPKASGSSYFPASPDTPRGRGMDSATFLAGMGSSTKGTGPRTLIEALSQMERDQQGSSTASLPAKPWLVQGPSEGGPARPSIDLVRASQLVDSIGPATPTTNSGLPPGALVEAGVHAQTARQNSRSMGRSAPADHMLAERAPSPRAEPQSALQIALEPQRQSDRTTGLQYVDAADDNERVIAPMQPFEGIAQGAELPGRGMQRAQDYFNAQQITSAATDNKTRNSGLSVGTPMPLAISPPHLVVVNGSPSSDVSNRSSANLQERGPVLNGHKGLNGSTQPVLALDTGLNTASVIRTSPVSASPVARSDEVLLGSGTHRAGESSRTPFKGPMGQPVGHRKALSFSHATRPPVRAMSDEPAWTAAEASTNGVRKTPARASTLSGPRTRDVGPRVPSKSAELLSFHAQQADAIAQAQAEIGVPVSLARSALASAEPPPCVRQAYFFSLSPEEQVRLHKQHEHAEQLALAAYRRAYDEAMRPMLAVVPVEALTNMQPSLFKSSAHHHRSPGRNRGTPLPASSTHRGPACSDRRPSGDETGIRADLVIRRPSARFMAPPRDHSMSTASSPTPSPQYHHQHPSLSTSASSQQHQPQHPAPVTMLTDELKRMTQARGAVPGEYSLTKRDLD